MPEQQEPAIRRVDISPDVAKQCHLEGAGWSFIYLDRRCVASYILGTNGRGWTVRCIDDFIQSKLDDGFEVDELSIHDCIKDAFRVYVDIDPDLAQITDEQFISLEAVVGLSC